jgi:tetratricopeptide (TPR) repeat protein
MKKNKLILGTFLLMSLLHLSAYANAQNTLDSLLVNVDTLNFQKKHNESLELCLEAYKADQTNYEILWRLAREYTGAGFHGNLSKKKKEQYLEKALSFAEEAVKINPARPEGYMRQAVVFGCFVSIRGGKEKVFLAKKVKEALETAIKIDPNYNLGYYGLGMWHREIADLSGMLKFFAKILYGRIPKGTFSDAIINLETSLAIKSDDIEVWYELGRTYMKVKNWQKAKSAFEKCISLQPRKADDTKTQKKSKNRLRKVKKKLN